MLAIFGTPGESVTRNPVIAILLGLTMGTIQLRHSFAAAHGTRPRYWPLGIVALALLAYVPLRWYGWDWAGAQAPLIASALMVLRGWRGVVCFAAPCVVTAAVAVVQVIPQPGPDGVLFTATYITVYWLAGLPALGFALYAPVRLARVVNELQAARTELAELAVTRERLRVSRDLHDLLGQSLAAVSLKSDLAARLLLSDQESARAEIDDLLVVARSALRDVRTVTRDERAVSLCAEIDGAAALLATAGIAARIIVDLPDLAAPVEHVLAWAVREGATNMIRHSDAQTCSIIGGRSNGSIRLEIVNDGAHPAPKDGTGVAGLSERAQALSGSVSACATDDGRFRLLVEIPGEEA
jgi:two-component system sensor histidine kinase DesK